MKHTLKDWVFVLASSMGLILTVMSGWQMLPALIISHALWDALVFVILPI